ncbi:MAG: chemotaxis protein CheW [Sphingomonas sp.]|nr:chemotaxis protein CheW [Sphingomonas sp.]
MADRLVLIVRLAGRRTAFPAAEVEAVVELEGLTPAPRAAPHVAGLSALRSRVLTVIDGLASLELGCAVAEGLIEAIVVNSGGHPYALLVDEVEDVVEAAGAPQPMRAPIGPGWDRIAIGMVDVGEDLLLLVDPHLIIAGPSAQAA